MIHKMLTTRLHVLFTLLTLAIVYYESSTAQTLVRSWGKGTVQYKDQTLLDNRTVVIPTDPDSTNVHEVTFNGDGESTIWLMNIIRWEEEKELKIDRDYFLTIDNGGRGNSHVTFKWKVYPNPKKEPLSFGVEVWAWDV